MSESFRHPLRADDRAVLIAAYRERFAGHVAQELAEAERLASHDFTFLGHRSVHGPEIAWDRDPVSGRTWERGLSSRIVYRGPARLGDVKLPWELNKHQYFFTLGKASWLTGDARYAREILCQIEQWIAANPCNRGVNWISALEVGTRAVSWILACPFFAEYCDAAASDRVMQSLAQHMLFVEAHLSRGRFANNHLVGDAAALVIGGLFLDTAASGRWLQTGLRHLEEEAARQVREDGVHAEQSVSYHRYVLDQYYLVHAFLEANGRRFSETTRAAMERMTQFLMDVLAPDGRAPGFGDGDSARAIWVRGDCPSDFRSGLALGAVLFDRSDFRAAAPLAEEVLWLFGVEGVAAFDRLAAEPSRHTSIAYPAGGYYVMRSGWRADDSVAVVDCGPLGYGAAGHGHADALSLTLHAQGFPFLIDPGAYSYNLDYEWRDAFRSTRAHNTIVIDGADQSVSAGRMAWSQAATARTRRWTTTPWFDLVEGEHDGYARLPQPVNHQRVVAFLKPDVWVIQDILRGAGAHDAEALLHVRPDCAVETAGHRFRLVSPEGVVLAGQFVDNAGTLPELRVVTGSDTERTAWYSDSYGTKMPSRALSVRRAFTGECVVAACLWLEEQEPLIDVSADMMTVRIRRGPAEHGITDVLSYRLGAAGDAQGADEFAGAILFQRRRGTVPIAVSAGDFRVLRIDGLIEARSDKGFRSLTLSDGRCEFVAHGSPADVHIEVSPGAVVDGRYES